MWVLSVVCLQIIINSEKMSMKLFFNADIDIFLYIEYD